MAGVKVSLLVLISVGWWSGFLVDSLKNFSYHPEKVTWTEAVNRCLALDMTLASIRSQNQNEAAKPPTDKAWTGLTQTWTWSRFRDSEALDSDEFQPWAPNEPKDKKNCTALRTNDGLWVSQDCTSVLQHTACYSDLDRTHLVLEARVDWSGARSLCLSKGSNLSSVQDQNQTQDVLDAFRRLPPAGPEPGLIWIGLSRRWVWWDLSPVPWSGWTSDADDPNRACMTLNRDGKWGDDKCDEKLAFICHKYYPEPEPDDEVTKRMNVKLSLNPGSADLKDPVVQQSILNQVGQRLRSAGVTGVKLSWGQCKKEPSAPPTDCTLTLQP